MKKLKKSKWLVRVAFISSITIVASEIFARFYLGLGNPPLSIYHSSIEYMYKPNQNIYRFGNHFFINEYGMRSDSFTKKKANEKEIRIMVFGDSVINGGNLTDQSELATTILKNKLSEIFNKDIIVGNISAGSWGPGNWLAYAKEYGFFNADIVILVISSHDYIDNPTFAPLNKNTHPTEKPPFAIIEGIQRYLPRFLPEIFTREDLIKVNSSNQEIEKAVKDLRNFLILAQKNSSLVLVFQHYEKSELDSKETLGHRHIRTICKELGISPHSLAPYFNRSIVHGFNPYRDEIHPNALGQKLISEAFLTEIRKHISFSSNSNLVMINQNKLNH